MNAPVIPSRDALVRDGIPPEVMAHFRARAAALRAEALAAFGRTFVHWLESLRAPSFPHPRDAAF